MNTSLAQCLRQHLALLSDAPTRRRAALIAACLIERVPAPSDDERELLEQFIQGDLTVEQVIAHLEALAPGTLGQPV